MLLRTRRTPAGFIQPCLPSPAERPPTGPRWIRGIKHDGFRMMVRRDAAGVRLLTRNGVDWTSRYPGIAAARGRAPLSLVPDRRRGDRLNDDGLAFDHQRTLERDGGIDRDLEVVGRDIGTRVPSKRMGSGI